MPAGTTKVPCKLRVHPVFHWRNFRTCGKLPSHHGTGCKRPFQRRAGGEFRMSIGTIILIILVIALLGGFSGIGGGPFYGTGYYGGGGPRALLLVFLVPFVLGADLLPPPIP